MSDIAPWPTTENEATPRAIARCLLVQASHDMCWMGDPDSSQDPKDMAIRASRISPMAYLAVALIWLDGGQGPIKEGAEKIARRVWEAGDDGSVIEDDLNEAMGVVGLDVEQVIRAYLGAKESKA